MTYLQSYVMVADGNDSYHVAAAHDGPMGPQFDIPPGERWTLVSYSEILYTPYLGRDPQEAMWHLVVRINDRDGNIATGCLRTQEHPTDDGLDYYKWRNVDCNKPITGPANVRVHGYNNAPNSVVFGFVGLWDRETVS